jgi:hypothetical protein
MNFQDGATAIVVFACAAYLIRAAVGTLRSRAGGACGCDKKCPAAAAKNGSVVEIQRKVE